MKKKITEKIHNISLKYPLYSQEKSKEHIIEAKIFVPMTGWKWYIIEAEKQDEDYICFAFTVSPIVPDGELGYVNEILDLNIKGWIRAELDLFFTQTTLKQVKKSL